MKWCCVLVSFLLAGCQTHPDADLLHRSQPLLGTFVTISAYGDRATVNRATSEAFSEIQRIDRLLSIHREDSEVSRVNAQAADGPVLISKELFHVLSAARKIAEKTDGSFDVTIRPLTDLWGFIWKQHRLPSSEELRMVLPKVNFRLIELNREEQTIHFLTRGVSIDLGGIGKGYAVDRAIEKLASLGITNAMVKAGGDLRVIGHPPGKAAWTVQMEDPQKKGSRKSIPLRDAAISTSGNYENFFVIEGKRYAHLLNPKTGLPVENVAACSVIAPTCTESDALATAFFVFGVEKTMKKFSEHYGFRFTTMPNENTASEIIRSPSFPDEN